MSSLYDSPMRQAIRKNCGVIPDRGLFKELKVSSSSSSLSVGKFDQEGCPTAPSPRLVLSPRSPPSGGYKSGKINSKRPELYTLLSPTPKPKSAPNDDFLKDYEHAYLAYVGCRSESSELGTRPSDKGQLGTPQMSQLGIKLQQKGEHGIQPEQKEEIDVTGGNNDFEVKELERDEESDFSCSSKEGSMNSLLLCIPYDGVVGCGKVDDNREQLEISVQN